MLAWHHRQTARGIQIKKWRKKLIVKCENEMKCEIYSECHGKFELKSRGGEGISQIDH